MVPEITPGPDLSATGTIGREAASIRLDRSERVHGPRVWGSFIAVSDSRATR